MSYEPANTPKKLDGYLLGCAVVLNPVVGDHVNPDPQDLSLLGRGDLAVHREPPISREITRILCSDGAHSVERSPNPMSQPPKAIRNPWDGV